MCIDSIFFFREGIRAPFWQSVAHFQISFAGSRSWNIRKFEWLLITYASPFGRFYVNIKQSCKETSVRRGSGIVATVHRMPSTSGKSWNCTSVTVTLSPSGENHRLDTGTWCHLVREGVSVSLPERQLFLFSTTCIPYSHEWIVIIAGVTLRFETDIHGQFLQMIENDFERNWCSLRTQISQNVVHHSSIGQRGWVRYIANYYGSTGFILATEVLENGIFKRVFKIFGFGPDNMQHHDFFITLLEAKKRNAYWWAAVWCSVE